MTKSHTLLLLAAALLARGAVAGAPGAGAAEPTPLPMPGRIAIFEDWAVGCDNRLACSAVSLLPDGSDGASDGDAGAQAMIERMGGPEAAVTLRLTGAFDGKIELLVDNVHAARLIATHNGARIAGAQALALIRLLSHSYAIELRAEKTLLDAPSLSGLAQALRYMDEQQGRVGRTDALVAIGDKSIDTARPVPPPVAIPIRSDGPPTPGPVALSEDEQQAARQRAPCGGRSREGDPIEGSRPITVRELDRDHALVLLACDAGADNVSAVPLIATGPPGQRSFEIARFDLVPGSSGEPGAPPLIVNPHWNPARGELSSIARGRPLGDCGTAETYRWDGAMFRLIEERSMPVCRGARDWPVLWTATPVPAPPSTPLPLSAGPAPSP